MSANFFLSSVTWGQEFQKKYMKYLYQIVIYQVHKLYALNINVKTFPVTYFNTTVSTFQTDGPSGDRTVPRQSVPVQGVGREFLWAQ